MKIYVHLLKSDPHIRQALDMIILLKPDRSTLAAQTSRKKNRVMISHNPSGSFYLFVVGRAGFEPATNGLKVRCSTS